MHLAAGQQKAQRPAERVGEQMDLGRQSTSGTPQSLVVSTPLLALPLPVAACWWALTRVASSIRYSLLGSLVSSAKNPLPDARLCPALARHPASSHCILQTFGGVLGGTPLKFELVSER